MCPEPSRRKRSANQGFALVVALFVIVIMAAFGLLIARYTTTTQAVSAEDYLWAQALHSAESVVRLNILFRDGGGGFGASPVPSVQNISTHIETDTFVTANTPAIIRVRADHATGVSRTVEAKYLLAP